MSITRRNFLKTGTIAAAGLGVRLDAITDWSRPVSGMFPDDDKALLKRLADAALASAKAGGASYADVRFTRMRAVIVSMNKMKVNAPAHANAIMCGVRVLVDNVWGFSAVATRDIDEVSELAKNAIEQAKINTWSGRLPVVLAPAPKVENGEWVMPVQRDPLDVPIDEILGDMRTAHEVCEKEGGLSGYGSRFDMFRYDKMFANSEGSSFNQRTYDVLGGMSYSYVMVQNKKATDTDTEYRNAPFIWPHGAGYEVVKAADHPKVMKQIIEEAKQLLVAPEVEPGSYDIVLDGSAMCGFISTTAGAHTQIDRALGFEANASGTSWVAPPEEVLGKLKFGNEKLTVKCNRFHEMSPANVKWDDEGVPPEEFTVIDKGIVVDYQTIREQVEWMKDYYARTGKPMRSHGCASAIDAGNIQLQAQPNVIMQPSAGSASVEDLMAGIRKGMLILGGMSWGDHQGITGQGAAGALCYEIRNGKRGRLVKNASFKFKTQETFKNLVAVGGKQTYEFQGGGTYKGEPYQIGLYSGTGAPAARFKDQGVTNISSKA
jgi:TldD protein